MANGIFQQFLANRLGGRPQSDAEVMQANTSAPFANALNIPIGAKRAERQAEVVARVTNEELQSVLAEGGDSVDLNRAMAQAQLRAARRIGDLGNHRAAAELYKQSAAILNATASQDAELGKLRSETDENVADAAARRAEAATPKDEFARLLNEREALMERLQTVDAASPTGQSITRRVDELSGRLGYMRTHVGRTEFDPTAELTKPVETDIQKRLINAQERIARLTDLQNTFNPALLTVLGKARVGAAYVLDKLNLADPNDKAAVTQWVNFSQSAYRDLTELLKEMSGAAVTPQEAERQLTVLVNPGSLANPFSGDTPEEAQRKLANNLAWVQAAQARYQDLLTKGLLTPGKALSTEQLRMLENFPIDSYMPKPTITPPAAAPTAGLPPGWSVTVK